ncbi:MAG: molybdopterin cofactor-binding domain-containing protein [Acidimicrobiales bacterium]
MSRRTFLGYVIAAPTLVTAASIGLAAGGPTEAPGSAGAAGIMGITPAGAAVPSLPQPSDLIDLNDILTYAADPTANLITVTINKDGTASFAIPRVESGQGITTSSAMLIAEELDLPVSKIDMTLADARPELLFNQFVAGSNTTISTYTPIRVAAALARRALLEAAAIELGDEVTNLTTSAGAVFASSGASVTYGQLAEKAAALTTSAVSVTLKPESAFTVIGTPTRRIDALAAVTGTKQYTMDIDVPGALPTMICRPPTINGTVESVHNAGAVTAMPGITDVAVIPGGVAVRGETFGQCIDAVRALEVTWGPGNVDHESDATVLRQLRAAQVPFATSLLDPLTETIEAEFVFYTKCNSALEPQTAIADVRPGSAEIWSSMQAPILVQETVAKLLGLPVKAVTAHVTEGGGAFGRRMFNNAPFEAAEISQKMGKPVKLMWARTDEFRVGRVHPMCTDRVQVTVAGNQVLAFEQRHTSVSTDYTQGFGEILTSLAAQLPDQNYLEYSNTIFETTVNVPYSFGATTQLLNEIFKYNTFHTGSVRNLYNPDVVTARELIVDRIAQKMGKDPYAFRQEFVNDVRAKAALDRVAEVGKWGRAMPAGTAQGIAIHSEYKGRVAALVEIDCRPATVDRVIENAVTGPRVTKVVFAVDAGLAVNPLGLQAQMMGGIMDGIAEVLTMSLHLEKGNYLEGSWDEYFYTRQWNVPFELEIIVMPPTTGEPGGAGEFGVAATKAAVACAYARATGTMPTSFPINHNEPLGFIPYPFVPPVPESPTNGLDFAY